ncbi:Na+/H+ antiporter subunit E [Salinivirga cyanobacteriivorans]|uniref:Mrp complex subunit E1 n=1 Tax=Salinivirga cyanobacteriivorans TaxID=1307839 RepID=A0A0S2I1M9_9BACT|nr:Na+/H+ antiporter subunit E [Salinivirga cyanobacteriivorans]ALO15932.1 Mrp complex subunit E1 [Salinivirga cyanobacteriivorans]
MKLIKKTYLLIAFILFYLYNLVKSNLFIAYDILTPTMHTKSDYVWVKNRTNSQLGLLLFSNLVSMTPGTLSIDYSEEKKALLIHYLYFNTNNKVIKEIETIQNKIIALVK